MFLGFEDPISYGNVTLKSNCVFDSSSRSLANPITARHRWWSTTQNTRGGESEHEVTGPVQPVPPILSGMSLNFTSPPGARGWQLIPDLLTWTIPVCLCVWKCGVSGGDLHFFTHFIYFYFFIFFPVLLMQHGLLEPFSLTFLTETLSSGQVMSSLIHIIFVFICVVFFRTL